MTRLPDLSRFELQCLRRLWERREATAREIHDDLPDAPTYSTVRKIIERLEEKGAVERVRLDGKALVYRPAVSQSQMLRKEVRRFLDTAFGGVATPLIAHLADMNELSLDDLRAVERQLENDNGPSSPEQGRRGARPPARRRRESRPRGGDR